MFAISVGILSFSLVRMTQRNNSPVARLMLSVQSRGNGGFISAARWGKLSCSKALTGGFTLIVNRQWSSTYIQDRRLAQLLTDRQTDRQQQGCNHLTVRWAKAASTIDRWGEGVAIKDRERQKRWRENLCQAVLSFTEPTNLSAPPTGTLHGATGWILSTVNRSVHGAQATVSCSGRTSD